MDPNQDIVNVLNSTVDQVSGDHVTPNEPLQIGGEPSEGELIIPGEVPNDEEENPNQLNENINQFDENALQPFENQDPDIPLNSPALIINDPEINQDDETPNIAPSMSAIENIQPSQSQAIEQDVNTPNQQTMDETDRIAHEVSQAYMGQTVAGRQETIKINKKWIPVIPMEYDTTPITSTLVRGKRRYPDSPIVSSKVEKKNPKTNRTYQQNEYQVLAIIERLVYERRPPLVRFITKVKKGKRGEPPKSERKKITEDFDIYDSENPKLIYVRNGRRDPGIYYTIVFDDVKRPTTYADTIVRKSHYSVFEEHLECADLLRIFVDEENPEWNFKRALRFWAHLELLTKEGTAFGRLALSFSNHEDITFVLLRNNSKSLRMEEYHQLVLHVQDKMVADGLFNDLGLPVEGKNFNEEFFSRFWRLWYFSPMRSNVILYKKISGYNEKIETTATELLKGRWLKSGVMMIIIRFRIGINSLYHMALLVLEKPLGYRTSTNALLYDPMGFVDKEHIPPGFHKLKKIFQVKQMSIYFGNMTSGYDCLYRCCLMISLIAGGLDWKSLAINKII